MKISTFFGALLMVTTAACGRPAANATVWTPAQPCDASACKLPNCRCASTDIPGGLPASETPQIVTVSFDDSLRVIDYDTYYSHVFDGRKNPNGCQVGVNFYVTNNYTDYALVEHLYYTFGYEMSDHSVDHREPTTWWENATPEEWLREIKDEKDILFKWGNIPEESIIGFRSPFLETAENELKVLHDLKFLFEDSMGTRELLWPFTLDYKSPICDRPATCPENSYPGLWIIPITYYKQKSGYPCSMLDACTSPITEDEWFDFFVDNFFAHYTSNRSPFGIYAHSAWFYYGPQRMNALIRFLDQLKDKDDVYIVTPAQMLSWVRDPTPLKDIKEFKAWQCPARPAPRCDYKAPTCSKTYPGNFHLRSCTTPCPAKFPGYGNPNGN